MEDRPKWYREIQKNTEYKYTLEELSTMPLPQLYASNIVREELTLLDAINRIKQRRKSV